MPVIRPPKPQYPIRVVSRLTGISLDTLRAWERRYSAVVPQRGQRGRMYSDADVARLQQLGQLVARGHAIGSIAPMSNAELERLVRGGDQLTPVQPPAAAAAADLGPLTDALDRYDLDAIEAILNGYAVLLPPRDLVFSVILPLLRRIGDRWQAGQLRTSQEHLVSAIVRSALGGLLRAATRPTASPRIVFATPSGERHELGLLCAALLAASNGYGVVYLGADLPAADIVHAAVQSGAAVVIVSLTTPGLVAPAQLRGLAKLPQDVQLWVGGPAADALLDIAGPRGRHLDGLSSVLPLLSQYAR